jgi:hypothetical protein
MAQQLAVIVLVDVAAAASAETLAGHTYMIDNMRLSGSTGTGTGNLVTAVRGTHWIDGSQADEQVMNWIVCGLGSIPPTVPRNYHVHRARFTERKALAALRDLAGRPPEAAADVTAELYRIHSSLGPHRHPGSTGHGRRRHVTAQARLDITGNTIAGHGDTTSAVHSHPPLRITDITGEAVDKEVMFPAQYGSPDLVDDGWYWSATVDTSRSGLYGYTMEIELYRLVRDERGDEWEPLHLTYESHITIDSCLKRNGFTGAGISVLDIPVPVAPARDDTDEAR